MSASHSIRTLGTSLLSTLTLLSIAACAAQPSAAPVAGGKLAACPSAPHCVSSDDLDAKHKIAALQIKGDPTQAWTALKAELDKMARTQTLQESADYRKVVVTTRLLRFKDDVEFLLRAERGEIAMRSTSNVGYYDFNVNRNRLEAIRSALQKQGVVQ
jgi:uncharacterized protein (DUF1499 family)